MFVFTLNGVATLGHHNCAFLTSRDIKKGVKGAGFIFTFKCVICRNLKINS